MIASQRGWRTSALPQQNINISLHDLVDHRNSVQQSRLAVPELLLLFDILKQCINIQQEVFQKLHAYF